MLPCQFLSDLHNGLLYRDSIVIHRFKAKGDLIRSNNKVSTLTHALSDEYFLLIHVAQSFWASWVEHENCPEEHFWDWVNYLSKPLGFLESKVVQDARCSLLNVIDCPYLWEELLNLEHVLISDCLISTFCNLLYLDRCRFFCLNHSDIASQLHGVINHCLHFHPEEVSEHRGLTLL